MIKFINEFNSENVFKYRNQLIDNPVGHNNFSINIEFSDLNSFN